MFDKGAGIVAAAKWDVHGGIESYARTLALRLADAAPGRAAITIDSRGKGSLASSAPVCWRAGRRIRALAAEGTIDVLHLQVSERASFLRKGYLLRLGRRLGLRTVLHHHGADLETSWEAAPAPFRAWMRATVRAADINVVLGSGTGRFLTRAMGLPETDWTVVPNGLPDLAEPPAPPADDGPFRPLLLAVLSDRKGVGEHLRALAALKAEGTAFHATVAGGGPELDRFKAMASELGLDGLCDFPGWVAPEDVPGYLARHDTYVLPSHREGLPIGILEAMRAARPVIATTVGAIPEALPDGPGVRLVPPGDVDALAAALTRLAESPARRAEEGAAARARYLAEFSFDAHLARITRVYRGETPAETSVDRQSSERPVSEDHSKTAPAFQTSEPR
jgi:glycosyltransferase involved in cell wall biosynthesis